MTTVDQSTKSSVARAPCPAIAAAVLLAVTSAPLSEPSNGVAEAELSNFIRLIAVLVLVAASRKNRTMTYAVLAGVVPDAEYLCQPPALVYGIVIWGPSPMTTWPELKYKVSHANAPAVNPPVYISADMVISRPAENWIKSESCTFVAGAPVLVMDQYVPSPFAPVTAMAGPVQKSFPNAAVGFFSRFGRMASVQS